MRGWIVLNNSAGRALRRKVVDVAARDVLDCAGGFGADDAVYITFRGVDGGQYVIATAIVCCSEGELRSTLRSADGTFVLRERDIQLLW